MNDMNPDMPERDPVPAAVARRHHAYRGTRLSQYMKSAQPRDIDEYIAGFPPDVREILQQVRGIVRKAAPDAEEAIKYQMPTFVLQGNLVHFAAFQKHIGFYPTPSAIKAFSGELADYVWAKGSVQFPLNRSVPFSLIRKMVEFRVKEAREKMATIKGKRHAG